MPEMSLLRDRNTFRSIVTSVRMKELKNKYKEILISSSLSLQIALFLNVYLAPIWASLSIYHLYVNADLENNEEDYESVLSVIFLTIAIPLEVVRLYLGYSGNLREKIPDLAGFLILSSFIQFPIQIYFLYANYKTPTTLLRLVIQSTATILLLFEISWTFATIRRMSQIKAQQFHIQALIHQSTSGTGGASERTTSFLSRESSQ